MRPACISMEGDFFSGWFKILVMDMKHTFQLKRGGSWGIQMFGPNSLPVLPWLCRFLETDVFTKDQQVDDTKCVPHVDWK